MYGVCLLESQGVRADFLLFPVLEPERVDLFFPVKFSSEGVDKPSAILIATIFFQIFRAFVCMVTKHRRKKKGAVT